MLTPSLGTNASPLLINGLVDSRASATTLSISAGQCSDSTNTFVMMIGNYLGANPDDTANTATTLDAASIGNLNGLDTDALANSTWYYVYIIGDSTGNKPTGTMLSANATNPLLPFGYDLFRRIGHWKTDGSAEFLLAYVSGNSSARMYEWDIPIYVLSGGTGITAPTAVTLTAGVPPSDGWPVYLNVQFTPATADDYATFVPGGSTSVAGADVSGVVAAKVQRGQVKVISKLVSSVAKVGYLNSAAACATTALVGAFDYYL
jgi:hypothetical protein